MKSMQGKILINMLLAVLAAGAVLVPAASAQPGVARPGQLPAIDAMVQAAIVDSVTATIDSVYVIGEGAQRIVAFLRRQLAEGAYRNLTDPAEFATRLEADAQATHHDGHFAIRAMQPLPPGRAERVADPRDDERAQRSLRERNFGFQKVELLSGNIGYLKLNQFADTDVAAGTAIAAMNFLADAGALIIDLRENGGGNASMIRLLATYLFKDQVHLINWYERVHDETVQSRTLDYVPGRRLAEVPVYVLTSRNTFSAAEEFTFDLKNLKRATIVGDTTGGGGHTVSAQAFDFKTFRIGLRVPYGRAYDPKTGKGWEGVGVIPDLAVPSAQALQAAHRAALQARVAAEKDPDARLALEWPLLGLDSRLNPTRLSLRQLRQYVGVFGPRRITLDGGDLYYQREDRPRLKLEPMGADLFRVGDLEYFRLRFDRDPAGRIVKVVGLYDDGRQDENGRSKG